jgi:type IV pilus assembly protein PilN
MIKINLLPFRLARKKENIRRQISIFLLMILLSAVGLVWYTSVMNNQIQSTKAAIKKVETQTKQYKEKANRVAKIKKNLKTLEDKLAIVASLKSKRKQQLTLFNDMTGLIIPERMWIESLKTNSTSVTIKGVAFDNPTIADFMEELEKSPLFSKVDLKTAKMKKFKDSVMLKSFDVLCIKSKPKTTQTDGQKQVKK